MCIINNILLLLILLIILLMCGNTIMTILMKMKENM